MARAVGILTTSAAVAGYMTVTVAVACSPMLQGMGLDVVDGTTSLLRVYGPEIKGVVVVAWAGYSASLFGVMAWREIAKLVRNDNA